MQPISQAADDLIIASEVSSKSYYDKHLVRPEWPGGYSGVTWGIGYDGGQASIAKIKKDWGDRVTGVMLDAMVSCSGVTGSAAKALLPRVRGRIYVDWASAIDVYEHIDLPEWELRICEACPGAEKLNGDCLGALTSLGYNRGAGGFTSSSSRFREMHAIRSHIIAGELAAIPGEFRSMQRLWPTMKGLRIRRGKEADLFEAGLQKNGGLATSTTATPMPRSRPNPAPPPLVPPAKGVSNSQIAVGTGGVIGAVKTTAEAHAAGLPSWELAAIAAGAVAVVAGAVYLIHAHQSQPVLARAKG